MKQQAHSSSYQQLGAKKKIEKCIDYQKKQGIANQHSLLNNNQTNSSQTIGQEAIQFNQYSQQNLKNGQVINHNHLTQGVNKQLQNGMSLEQIISYQNNQLHLNYLNQQNYLSQIATPIVQTAQKNKKSRSPSQKSGSQIKLKSAQLENIQKQFNKLLEKENKQLNSSNSNSSANKSYIAQQQQQSALLTGGGSVTYLNQTKSSAMQRRQRNLTQLNINSNCSLKKGNSSSLSRINRSLTPNSRTNSSSLQRNKGGNNTNLLLQQSGNQTTANITQKRIDFAFNDKFNSQKQYTKSTQQINPNYVQIQQQLQLQAQIQNSQQQKNSAMFSTSQQSSASVNGEVINNRLASIIQKNPQNLEEYSIKDKQLNKILQQLLQQRMKQQQQTQQQNNQQVSNKNFDCSASPTMSLMSSKPSTLQSYYAHLGLNHGKNSQFQNGNNTNSLQGYSFLNSSTQAGASMQNTNLTLSNQNIANQSNFISNNNTNQTQPGFNQSSLSAQLQARNFENNSIFQEQLRIEESFQQRYQQYKEKFSAYQSESQNNSKMINNTQKDFNIQQILKSKDQGEFINTVQNEQIIPEQTALDHEDNGQNTQNCEEELKEKEKEENFNTNNNIQNDLQYNSVGNRINSNINNPKELLSPGDDLAVSNYQSSNIKQNYMTNQNNFQGSNMAPMTINTESDSVQLMSAKERENMMQYIENAQFPTGSTTYQDLIQNIPNDIHQEIILIYEQKIKEITEKFQHRDIVIRQSLMKLEKENSILLTKVQEQQEEIFRYKKLRELETKLIKKLEGEIKLEKAKYQKLFQQKFYKKGSDSKNFNNQLIDELNKKLSETQQEKECLEYLLKDALLKTELLKAKESVIFRQIPFSNNLNTSTSTISIGGNQNISNFNQLFSHAGNSSSNGNFQIPPAHQVEYVNLLSLDNSLNKSQNYPQQQQLQQQQQIQQQQQFQQQQNQRLFTHETDNEQSPDNNFLRVRNKSHDQQYFKQQQMPDLNMMEFRNQLLTEDFEQQHKQYPYMQQQIIQTQNQQLKNQLNQQQAVNIEAEFQNSERSNFMTAYQNSQGDLLQNNQNSQNYPSNYILRKHIQNQNNQQEETQGSEMRSGSYMGRSLSQNQQILPEDYYYSENEQHEDYDFQNQDQQHQLQQPRLICENNQKEIDNQCQINYHITQQQQQQQQNEKQKYPLYFETNNQENIQTFEFNSNMNYLMNQYSDIRNSQNLHNSAQLIDIRSPSNSQGICTIPISSSVQPINGNNNYLQLNHQKNNMNSNDMLILDVNEKSDNRSYLINNSQVIHEEASSADNTTQNNDNNQNGSNFSQNNSNKMKRSSNNLDSSSAVIEVNVNDTNNLNHELFQKSDNSKIFVENETLSKSDNIENEHEHENEREHEDEDIEAEFKEISESNRRREQSQEKQEDMNQEKVQSNRNQHEVQSLTEEYLKNKVEILNNASFNQNNINQQNTINQNQQPTNENSTIDQNQKEEEDQAIVQYFNTKNLYLQKYYASQNNSSGINSKSLNSSSHTNEKNNSNSNNINN
ncbi:hypothetical protein TTHERM_00852810 (macronuclear) [Tetrahymena thermophila SB210]|uniref:Uncharacterized protein n=1 Tax=Tetrahymena thermophila (strain SB210) TaxID=312017 RepID=Q24E59_TETTS|nr:hypothetical protein TTHERM_00852810 [Tetrahymena thermophila SB210]EAS06042.2 hypothetical protein TTHERM_00852810 [Tetrahymena thermophila SB210]|eukprot:XP_001026287.2 hypothetical protein TTHERM_00852810 [Tetrahymena thermophila SB210]